MKLHHKYLCYPTQHIKHIIHRSSDSVSQVENTSTTNKESSDCSDDKTVPDDDKVEELGGIKVFVKTLIEGTFVTFEAKRVDTIRTVKARIKEELGKNIIF